MEVVEDNGHAVNVSHFDLITMIGHGGYGKVYLSRKIGGRDDKVLYAMKVQEKKSLVARPSYIEQAKTERNVISNIAITTLT